MGTGRPSGWQTGERAFKPYGLADAPSLTLGFRPVARLRSRGAMHITHTTRETANSGDPNIRTSPADGLPS